MQKVVFTLDPSFGNNHILTVEEAPFRIMRMGYGTFDLPIEIHFKKETGIQEPLTIIHSLSFEGNGKRIGHTQKFNRVKVAAMLAHNNEARE